MKYLKSFNEGNLIDVEKEVKFTNKRNRNIIFSVFKGRDGRITKIEKSPSIRFPFNVGELFNRTIETWACNNNYLMDDKDTCPEKKVMGIRTSDIPKGHELRNIYPNKFK